MPTKKQIIKYLEKVPEHEELFLLRAQDESAGAIVMRWVQENLYSAPEEKIRLAIDCAFKMIQQEDIMRKKAD